MERFGLLIFAVCLMAAWGADWTQWRGPSRDGQFSFSEPKSWPDKLNVKWKVTIGEGYASPLLAGGKIFEFTRQADDEVAMGIDPGNGKVLWRQSYPAPYEPVQSAARHGKGPKSTPLVYDGRLYTFGISGILSSFDAATGKLEWRKEYSKDFKGTWPQFGTSMSPVGVEGMIVVSIGTNDDGAIAAYDAKSGVGSLLPVLRVVHGVGRSATLRTSIGDWRDKITWRPEIFTDLAARADFYVGLGFNPALTDFPLPAFEQVLDIAGLRRELPLESEREDDAEEDGLARTNAAHDRLQRMERRLRKFIDEQMTQAFGADWPKHRLPNGVYDDWREKKRKAEEAGTEERPLIEYADFMHYAPLICRGDNWREVFQPFFVRQESVRESFQRLHPIRLDIAHARLITQDDELLLCVEVKRLVKVIRQG